MEHIMQMPQTMLFPENDKKITIQQGNIGDCYLLSGLECILNDAASRQKIQSLFTTNEKGIMLTMPRNNQSPNLIKNNISKNYQYSSDATHDIFVISNAQLQRIDQDKNGAQTNALAVKILEHIVSYYYNNTWADNLEQSIFAHDNREINLTSSAFIGKLFDLSIQDYYAKDLDLVIKLKLINPNQPIYLSMKYGAKDEYGNIHGRHALVVKEIKVDPNNQKSWIVSLINPWNNTQIEDHSLNDIKIKTPRFCIFNYDQNHNQQLLLNFSIAELQYIYQHPNLFQIINELLLAKQLNIQEMQIFIKLNQSMPEIINFYEFFKNPNSNQNDINFSKLLIKSNGEPFMFVYHSIDACIKTQNTKLLENLLKIIPDQDQISKILNKIIESSVNKQDIIHLLLQTLPSKYCEYIENLQDYFIDIKILIKDISENGKYTENIRINQLLSYSYSDNSSFIPRYNNLPWLFNKKFLKKSDIQKLPFDKIITETLTLFLTNEDLHQLMTDDIKKISINDIDEQQLQEIIEEINLYFTPQKICTKLCACKIINPSIAEKLLNAVINNSQSLWNDSWQTIVKESIRNNEDQAWLLKQNNDIDANLLNIIKQDIHNYYNGCINHIEASYSIDINNDRYLKTYANGESFRIKSKYQQILKTPGGNFILPEEIQIILKNNQINLDIKVKQQIETMMQHIITTINKMMPEQSDDVDFQINLAQIFKTQMQKLQVQYAKYPEIVHAIETKIMISDKLLNNNINIIQQKAMVIEQNIQKDINNTINSSLNKDLPNKTSEELQQQLKMILSFLDLLSQHSELQNLIKKYPDYQLKSYQTSIETLISQARMSCIDNINTQINKIQEIAKNKIIDNEKNIKSLNKSIQYIQNAINNISNESINFTSHNNIIDIDKFLTKRIQEIKNRIDQNMDLAIALTALSSDDPTLYNSYQKTLAQSIENKIHEFTNQAQNQKDIINNANQHKK